MRLAQWRVRPQGLQKCRVYTVGGTGPAHLDGVGDLLRRVLRPVAVVNDVLAGVREQLLPEALQRGSATALAVQEWTAAASTRPPMIPFGVWRSSPSWPARGYRVVSECDLKCSDGA